jgi:PTS system nitrogen regulatory IIA component
LELTIKDISGLLMMTEKEIISLIKKQEIPFQLINDKELFNKQKIIEWALIRNLPLNISNHTKMTEYKISSLNSVLSQESFFYDCDFHENDYIDKMVHLIDIEKNVDREIIVQLLLNREELMSTSIGNGISLPHPRIPLMVGKNKPLVNFFFPKTPLKLNSLDSKPVHTLILLISQTIKQHLSILAHLSFLLSKPTFHSGLENRLDYKQIIDIISKIESERNDR